MGIVFNGRIKRMPDLDTLLSFIAASTILAFAPGPDNIFVLTQSVINGRSAGFKITLGLCTGLMVHTTIVALGVSAIFQTSMLAFNILKYAGAAYLLYLSWKAFRASSRGIKIDEAKKFSSWQLYRRGIIMNITNPKVSIFFMAFLPQFAYPSRGSITVQLFLLGGVFILDTIIVFGGISQLAGIIGQWLSRTKRAERLLNILAGTVFAVLAVKLAITER
jgi:threonine/homoserine/homoserine lactone efflux protein